MRAPCRTKTNALCEIHLYSYVPLTLNSLFSGGFSSLRAANPMKFFHFWHQAVAGVMKFPVIFPVSREFEHACPGIRFASSQYSPTDLLNDDTIVLIAFVMASLI